MLPLDASFFFIIATCVTCVLLFGNADSLNTISPLYSTTAISSAYDNFVSATTWSKTARNLIFFSEWMGLAWRHSYTAREAGIQYFRSIENDYVPSQGPLLWSLFNGAYAQLPAQNLWAWAEKTCSTVEGVIIWWRLLLVACQSFVGAARVEMDWSMLLSPVE